MKANIIVKIDKPIAILPFLSLLLIDSIPKTKASKPNIKPFNFKLKPVDKIIGFNRASF